MLVRRTRDFDVSGRGDNPAWACAERHALTRVGGQSALRADVSLLHSDRGLYCRFSCEATRLYAPLQNDFAPLYQQDVVEIFLQPDAAFSVYLEYELSPLGAELPLMVVNRGRGFYGWLPFEYEGERRASRGATVLGGEARDGATCVGWVAECFLPFALWEGVLLAPPASGDVWRGNFFRIEHDSEDVSRFAYDSRCGEDFHRPEWFAPLALE